MAKRIIYYLLVHLSTSAFTFRIIVSPSLSSQLTLIVCTFHSKTRSKITMKSLAVLALVLFAASAMAEQDASCKDLQQKGELGIRKLLFVEKDSRIPQTDDEFSAYCKSGKEMYKGLVDYKKCLKPLPQEIMNTATKSIASVLKKHCGDQAGRQESLRVLKCAGDNTLVTLHKCAGQTLNVLDYLANNAAIKSKDIVPQMCCMAHLTRECFEKELTSKCAESNAPSVKDHFSQLVTAISKDVIDLACDDVRNIKQCEAKLPAEIAKLREVGAAPSGDLSARQFVAPVIKIGEKIVE